MSSNADVIRGVYEAFARGDIAAGLSVLAPNVRWTEAEGFPYGGTYKETGRRFSTPFVHVWHFENGKVVRFHQHTDTAVIQKVLR